MKTSNFTIVELELPIEYITHYSLDTSKLECFNIKNIKFHPDFNGGQTVFNSENLRCPSSKTRLDSYKLNKTIP